MRFSLSLLAVESSSHMPTDTQRAGLRKYTITIDHKHSLFLLPACMSSACPCMAALWLSRKALEAMCLLLHVIPYVQVIKCLSSSLQVLKNLHDVVLNLNSRRGIGFPGLVSLLGFLIPNWKQALI